MLKVEIGGVAISLSFVDGKGWIPQVSKAMHSFLTRRKRFDLALKVHCGFLPHLNVKRVVFNSGGNWTLFKDRNNRLVFSLTSPATGPHPYALAVVDSQFKVGDLYLREPNYFLSKKAIVNPLEYPLDEVLVVHLLSRNRGILLHGCGIKYKGEGLLFLGTSGKGKSTIANLWKEEKEVAILSDDRIVVRKKGSNFWIYGTPWHGDAKLCSPQKVVLKKIFFLKHGKKNSLKKMKLSEIISQLVVCSFPPFWDKKGMKFILSFCSNLAKKIPSYELNFLPNRSVLDFIKRKV
ncbi:MAG: hypothetical protein DRP81_08240 [Candidatus Omnitrophota bacterium]|nr:MAG: hypothetical protein DRP81_08240 [Candidatus Omnitrophota bacterium]